VIRLLFVVFPGRRRLGHVQTGFVVEPSQTRVNPLARELGLALRDCRGVRLALLFGSHARGDAREGSDVDIAVDAPCLDLIELAARLSQAIRRDVDVVPVQDAGVPLLEEIVRDAIVIYEAREGAGALWHARALATLETDRPWFDRMRAAWMGRLSERGVLRG
jgi:predicted nucleotidyltransferase